MRKLKSLIHDARAAAALEFALIVPVLMFVLFGTIEIGRFAFAYNSMDAALAKAGREWMINPAIGLSDLETIFCSRTHLIDCTQTDFSFTTVVIDGQEWRTLHAQARFESPLYPLMPLPTIISLTEQVPIFGDA
jgi:Flp pilus assembly protein TadG